MMSRLIGIKNIIAWCVRMILGKYRVDYSVKDGERVYCNIYGWVRVVSVNYVVLAVAVRLADGAGGVITLPMWSIRREE